MKPTLLSLIILFVAAPVAVGDDGAETIHLDRDGWIWATVLELRSFRPNPDAPQIRLREENLSTGKRHAFLIPRKGFFRFGEEGSWVYALTHSSHEDDMIGDISLATDESGNIWRNDGHVCGALWLPVPSDQIPGNSMEFFRRTQAAHPENCPWVHLASPDPPELPKALADYLASESYEGVLVELPEVKPHWQAEQGAIAIIERAGATVFRQRLGPPRLVVALPDVVGTFFDRVTRVEAYGRSDFTDAIFVHVRHFRNLRVLAVSKTPLSGSTFEALSSLRQLEYLYFCNCPLRPEAFEHIASSRSIISIRVDGTPITGASLGLLGQIPSLRSIWAFDTAITEAEARRFVEAHPEKMVVLQPGKPITAPPKEEPKKAPLPESALSEEWF